MPVAQAASGTGAAPGGGAAIPFTMASNLYNEQIFRDTFTTGGTASEFVHNITPGGFLRGVRLFVSASGGVGGTPAPDNPWNVIQSVSLENIDGSPICYPMTGYAYYLVSRYCRPWMGDPAQRPTYSQSINPGLEIFIMPEIRDTLGCLANTDARAQYRIRYTLAPTASFTTGTVTTNPTITVTGRMECWAQTDTQDLHGNPIQAVPDGLAAAHITRHQIITLNGAGADNTVQLTNTGNELRSTILVCRDSTGARQDYLSDPIRVRLDNRSMEVSSPTEVWSNQLDFYSDYGIDVTGNPRPTGVYVFPRFRRPGDSFGTFWMPTANSTYLIYESTTSSSAVNVPGTIEAITDEMIPVLPVPPSLEGL
jgi:hypothetical protein